MLELTFFGEARMKQVTARRCCEEIEQDILEGGLKRPFEEVANPNEDPKEEQELARPIGCRWGKGVEKRGEYLGSRGAGKSSVCLRRKKKASILQHLEQGRSVSIYGAPSIYRDTVPYCWAASPFPPFLRERRLLP